MFKAEDIKLYVIDHDLVSESSEEVRRQATLGDEIYPEIVQEWSGYMNSPEAFGLSRDEVFSMLCSLAINHGLHCQAVHDLCTNAELEAAQNLL